MAKLEKIARQLEKLKEEHSEQAAAAEAAKVHIDSCERETAAIAEWVAAKKNEGALLLEPEGVGHRPAGTRAAMVQTAAEANAAKTAYLEEQIATLGEQKAQAHAAWQDAQLELFDSDEGSRSTKRKKFASVTSRLSPA